MCFGVIYGTMMNYIWPLMILFSFFSAIATKNTANLSSAIISSGTDAISLAIKLMGMICLWSGVIHIAEKSGLTKTLCKLLTPVLKLLFPGLKDKKTLEAIAMNMTANVLGLDNAATPLGLEAMNRLQTLNPNQSAASDYMVRFVVINTACIHIVPTTVALLRQQYGSNSPTDIIFPALITSVCTITVGLLMTTILKKVFR